MDCKKADQFMMKYMDDVIAEDEKLELDEHLKLCEDCREAFTIYGEMSDYFSTVELIEAPENFEMCVMEKISLLPKASEQSAETTDNLIHIACGMAFVLFGICIIAVINNEAVLRYVSGGEVLLPLAVYLQGFIDTASSIVYDIFKSFNAFIAQAKYYMLAVLVFIIALQVFVYKNDKAEA